MAIANTYTALLTHEQQYGGHSNWKLGVYPTIAVSEAKVPTGTMYVLEENGEVCASMVLNHDQAEEYAEMAIPRRGRSCDGHSYAVHPAAKGGPRIRTAAGAQYAALTGITPHIVFDELSKTSPIPLISMVDTARDYAAENGCKKICLLGTLPTMEGMFFQNSFAKRGIEVVTPNAEERIYIGTKIETELEFGKVLPETQRAFKEIAERIIREEQVQAVVLGCTELPLIFDGVELPVPYINVMQVHINALVDLIMQD